MDHNAGARKGLFVASEGFERRTGDHLAASTRAAGEVPHPGPGRKRMNSRERRRAHGVSHLTLALLYADAGLLKEAEQELTSAAPREPQLRTRSHPPPPDSKLMESLNAGSPH